MGEIDQELLNKAADQRIAEAMFHVFFKASKGDDQSEYTITKENFSNFINMTDEEIVNMEIELNQKKE